MNKAVFLFVYFLFFSIGAKAQLNPASHCEKYVDSFDETECHALIRFYNSNAVYGWDYNDTWLSDDISRWKGVEIEDGHVVEIAIAYDGYYLQKPLSGPISIELTKLTQLRKLSLFKHNLSGGIPEQFSSLKKLESLVLYKNNLSGEVPAIWSDLESLQTLTLADNNFEGRVLESLSSNVQLKHINLKHNNFKERIPESLANIKGLQTLDLGFNRFYGEVPKAISSLNELRTFSLIFNYFLWGDVEGWLDGFESLSSLKLAGNQFWGRMPESLKESEKLRSLYLSGNHIIGDLKNDFQHLNNWAYALVDYQSMTERQASLDEIKLSIGENGHATLTPRVSGEGVKVFIVPGDFHKIDRVTGCSGKLKENVYQIPDASKNCTVVVRFRSCTAGQCVVDIGSTNNIPNSSLENPDSSRVLSGVTQIRGWVKDSEWQEDFLWSWPSIRFVYVQFDDGPKTPIRQSLFRADVVSAMALNEKDRDLSFAWSYLLNSAVLENGKHRIRLYSRANLLLADREIDVFNPLTDGERKYISGVEKTLEINDFPIVGHRSKIAFNQAQQSFTVIDQFDELGNSLLSDEVFFVNDSVEKSAYFGEDSVAKIENPDSAMVFSGVQAIRGWFRSGLIDKNGTPGDFPQLVLDDGDEELGYVRNLNNFEKREDVNSTFGLLPQAEVGWSMLGYSGQYKNGWHRFRLQSSSGFSVQNYVYREAEFLSFTPVNENGEQFYVRSYDQDILVEDFPYQGSDVTLRFDPAGQNFVIVDQHIH